MDQRDDEPDGDAGHSAGHQGHQEKELRVGFGEIEDRPVLFTEPLPLGEHQVESSPHREMGDEDVDDGDNGDQEPAADFWDVPYRIVHTPPHSLPFPKAGKTRWAEQKPQHYNLPDMPFWITNQIKPITSRSRHKIKHSSHHV